MTTETLTRAQIAFEIRYALGQAGAQTFIDCHAKSPETRLRGLDVLTAKVLARFEGMSVLAEVPEASGPLFGVLRRGGDGA